MIIHIGSFFKRNYKGLITLVSVLFVFIVAYPGRFYFLNDDFIHIPLAGKGRFVNSALYRPLSDLSLWIDYKLWGKNPFGYHLTNLLIHLTNSFLVYKLARLVFTKHSTNQLCEFKSFFVGLLFLVYAYHSEPLFWIIGRGGSLVTTFFLLAFYFYYKSELSRRYLTFSVLFFVIGLFVYETIWIFPAIVTMEYIVNRSRYKQFDRILIIWAAFLLFFIFRYIYIDSLPDEYELGLLYEFEIFQLLYKYNTLLARCFLPPMANSILFVSMYMILLCGIMVSVYQINSKRLLFHIICLMIAILPTISLGIDTHDSESERFIYLATVFAIFIIVELISYLRKPLFILTFLLISFFHSFKLFETSNSYEFGSMIAKESLQFIRMAKSDKLSLYNLPKQYKGALIFRIGFENALTWINDQNVSRINVVNQMEYTKSFGLLFLAEINRFQFSHLQSNNKSEYSDGPPTSKNINDIEAFYWQRDSLYKLSY